MEAKFGLLTEIKVGGELTISNSFMLVSTYIGNASISEPSQVKLITYSPIFLSMLLKISLLFISKIGKLYNKVPAGPDWENASSLKITLPFSSVNIGS